jgi:hypothetical protein
MSIGKVVWQRTINHFILLYSAAAHCAPLQLTIFYGNTMHHFILLYSIATHFIPLHSAVFCDNTLCTTSYEYSMANHCALLHMTLWQHTMHNFILLHSVATQYACVWPTKDLLCMSCITCTCKKSGLVIVYSCTQVKSLLCHVDMIKAKVILKNIKQ